MSVCVCVVQCTFWWGMIGMGDSILGVAVGTGAGRLDLEGRNTVLIARMRPLLCAVSE